MSGISVFLKHPNGAVSYIGEATEVVLKQEHEDPRPHFRSQSNRSLELSGSDLGPLTFRKLRRVEVVSAHGGVYGKRMSGVIDDVGTLLLIDAGRVRATYDNTAQFASRHTNYGIQFIDV